MGKGDKKSKRGKIIRGSFGVRRRKKTIKNVAVKLSGSAVKAVEKVEQAPPADETVKKAVKPTVKTTKPKTASKSTAKPAVAKAAQEAVQTAEKKPKPAAKPKKTVEKK